MKYIVYLTINKKNKKIYVGVHGTDTDKFDGYLGCGVYVNKPYTYKKSKTAFQCAVNKYGPDSFLRVTLRTFDNDTDAYNLEARIVDKNFLKRKDIYNMALGGFGGDLGVTSKEIFQYDLNGIFIKEFESCYEASRQTGIPSSTIKHSIQGHWPTNNSFWMDYKVDRIDLKKYKVATNKIKVYQYDENGEYEKEYESLSDAANSYGREDTAISRAIKSGYKFENKYFSYKKDLNYSRAKSEYIRNLTVYQYDLEGNYIQSFNSKAEAIRSIGEKHDRIGNAIKMQHSFGGFQWSYEKVDKMSDKSNSIHTAPRKVAQCDLEGNVIKIYDSVSKCRKDFSACQCVLSGNRNKANGYFFKYID